MPHTADVALRVWGETVSDLFLQAGIGLGEVSKAQPDENAPVTRSALTLHEADHESLLVAFLSEVLFYLERDGILFAPETLVIEGTRLSADLAGRPVVAGREIKAVTYSNLEIVRTGGRYEATLVFDL